MYFVASNVNGSAIQDVAKAYQKLIALLQQNISKAQTASQHHAPKESESITAMTLDILYIMLPFLSAVDSLALFDACSSTDVLESKDNGVQKRGYKILTKLVGSGNVEVDASKVLQRLEQSVDGLVPAAKKVRASVFCHGPVLITCSPLLGSDVFAQFAGKPNTPHKPSLTSFDNS